MVKQNHLSYILVFITIWMLSSVYANIKAEAVCTTTENSIFPIGKCMTVDEYWKLGEASAYQEVIEERNPIILIPGLGGSALEAKLNNANEPFWLCSKNSDWTRIWLSLGSLIPGYIDCFFYNMGIHYNEDDGTYFDNEGVTLRAKDFGGLSGIDYLDYVGGSGLFFTSYYAPLIKNLEKIGYRKGVDLKGIPFDWRKPGDKELYDRIKSLVELTYEENGNKKVNFVAHSFGNIQIAIFLNEQDDEWREKYVSSFISLAAPWKGAPQALRAVISGDDFGIPSLSKDKIKDIAREAGGVVMLTPIVEGDDDDDIIVSTPEKSYKSSEINQLLTDIGADVTLKIKKETSDILKSIQFPKVPLHCLYGINQATEQAYRYESGFKGDPEIIFTEYGDGVVSGDSLKVCEVFQRNNPDKVNITEFDLANHMTILDEPDVFEYIVNIATGRGKQ